MKRNLFLTAVILLSLTWLTSCYYDKEDYLYSINPNAQPTTCDTTNVTFSAVVKPIFDNNCSGCHSSGNFVSTSYTTISTYLTANSQNVINDISYIGGQPMPPTNKMSDCDIKKMKIWILAGFPNN